MIRMKCILMCFLSVAAQEMGTVRKFTENKFVTFPGLPACMLGAVENGDPSKGPSMIALKGAAGCVIPWHWHTPNEQVMIISGKARMEMKGGKSEILAPGTYALMPGKHMHQFTCVSACTGFVHSDAVFDIHYVDSAGKEISPEAAMAKKK